MCSRITCDLCRKPTWQGCGQHIEDALVGVPESDRCQGHDERPKAQPLSSSWLPGR
jgi:hypothetical protein